MKPDPWTHEINIRKIHNWTFRCVWALEVDSHNPSYHVLHLYPFKANYSQSLEQAANCSLQNITLRHTWALSDLKQIIEKLGYRNQTSLPSQLWDKYLHKYWAFLHAYNSSWEQKNRETPNNKVVGISDLTA